VNNSRRAVRRGCGKWPACGCTEQGGCPTGHPFFGSDEFIERLGAPADGLTLVDPGREEHDARNEFDESATVAAPAGLLVYTVIIEVD